MMMPVYFIQAGSGPVKIGYAGNPQKRCLQLQIGHYEPLQILRVLEGNRTTEKWLHNHFDAWRIKGEWFTYAPDMLTVQPALPPKTINGCAPQEVTSLEKPGVMKLKQFLYENDLTATKFAAQIGRSISSVTRAANGEVMPDRETMELIIQATNGQVQPNDFYGLGAT